MDEEVRQARVDLRERFLRLISTLSSGEQCSLKLYDKNEYKCKIRAFDPAFQNMVVENLNTPHPLPQGRAIIRLSDVISIQCEVEL